MSITPNKTFVFKRIPTRLPVAGDHVVVEDRPIDLDAPLDDESFLIKGIYASFDPYQRGGMRDPSIKNWLQAYPLDGPVPTSVIGKVLKSASPNFVVDDIVHVWFAAPTAEYGVIPAGVPATKLDVPQGVDVAHFLGALGLPGLTAIRGLLDIGKPKKGEVMFVSSAAGAVGQMAGQLAKAENLTVIGSVGSDEKLEFITKELGFDAGFNYKTEKPADALKRLAPEGINIYFENVGGEHLEAALDAFQMGGRIIHCGAIAIEIVVECLCQKQISEKNVPVQEQRGVRNMVQFTDKQLTMTGYLVDFTPESLQEFYKTVIPMLQSGKLKAKLSITEGIENAAEGFVGMLAGENFGKAVLKI
ncbi:NADP-dependent oxidoreductase RED1 [Colletotrichum liriopes]|uniref:Dehydrogenase FUB6 n=1 Tax=Colletotrichum liriopes TaxID=708192 RepID=A0AA37H0K8_9PEZI|nr:NADP-dependent oxidoreductase RED1 [Colletotrichum liriopes]